ncbi:4387_t:CDS:2, partial [Funneliformis caledonium]
YVINSKSRINKCYRSQICYSHSSLLECFNGIQNMLSSELQKAEYRDYLSDLPFSIASSSATQIDVCFEYYSKIIPFEQYGDLDNIDEFDTSA